MAANGINIGSIYASLEVDSGSIPAGLAQGERAIKAFEGEIRNLDAMLKAGAIGGPEHAARVGQLTQAINDMASRMQAANASVLKTMSAVELLDAKMKAAGNSSGRAALGLMQLGYMADDAQYGISALVNNIAPLVYNLTGNAGLAAAASIAAVAANQLWKQWDQVKEVMGDTTGAEQAKRSIEGLTEALKKLQADADNFSMGDALAAFLGFNPDAGKQAMAANMGVALEQRQKAEKAAKKMEAFEDPDAKKDREHYEQAIGEAPGGFPEVARKLGGQILKERGVGHFLSIEKGMGGWGESEREEYARLQDKVKTGLMTDEDRDRKHDLEAKADAQSKIVAKEMVGGGSFDKEARKQLVDRFKASPDLYGPDLGPMVAGEKDTKEEKAKKEKEADRHSAESERAKDEAQRLRKKFVDDKVMELVPNLKDKADRLADAEFRHEKTRGESLLEMQDALASDELSPEEIRQRAEDAMDATGKEAPLKRRKRIRQRDMADAAEVVPGVKDEAEAAVAKGLMTGRGTKDFAAKLKEKLAAEMGEDAAANAAGGLMEDADRKVKGRLRNLGNHQREHPDAPAPSRSATYATTALTDRVQGAIGDRNDEPKKHTTLQQKMVELLAQIARKDGPGFEVT